MGIYLQSCPLIQTEGIASALIFIRRCFAGGLGSVGVLFSGFTPWRESADSGITSMNWLNSFAGRGISTRMIRTPYCAASFGSRGA